MKKLFTLFALLACFLGAKAVEVVDAEVNFSKYSDISEWNFPYSWGGSESAKARLSIANGCLHFHSEEATDPSWDCQFFPIGGVNAEVGLVYTLHYKMKGSVAQNISMLGFGQTPYGQFAVSTDWVEGTVDYEATSTDGNILLQCGDYVGDWDIEYLKITHEERGNQRPVEWVELLTNGDAETPWTEEQAGTAFDDTDNNFKICAWGKTNQDNPVPAEIVALEDGGHAFIVRATDCPDPEADASAWDNQFWIESTRQIKAGEQVKVHFRYKASQNANTNTQIHHQTPSDYMHWQAIGDIAFTTEWQEFDKVVAWPSGGDDQGWSIAFNLNPDVKTATDFYFDDLSIAEMKLDHGFFVAGSNPDLGIEYDFDNAVEFVEAPEEGDGVFVAVIGSANDPVSQIMISTVRGNDAAFKTNTLKPSGTITGSADDWLDYADASNAKINLPGYGEWKIYIDTEYVAMAIELVNGTLVTPIDIKPNPTEVVVHGQERDYTSSEQEGGTGNAWDNQFFIIANRALSAGEVTVIEFDYQSTVEAKSTTQCHGQEPGSYMHWKAIGDVDFTTEEQHFSQTFTIPAEADGMWTIAFNLAEIKEANDYMLKNFVWKLEDNTESLIDQTGTKNFYLKEGAGDTVHEWGTTGIYSVVNDGAASAAIYNIAGQRVSKDYKGLVVKEGKKFVVK